MKETEDRMPHPDPATRNPALLPSPALFDVTQVAQRTVDGVLERVAIAHLELAPNPRQRLSEEGIRSLAGLLMRTGQLIPCIGRRPNGDKPRVVLFDGRRLLLAAQASHQLAGTDGFEGLSPVRSLIVLLLDHDPSPDEIRRVQAQANQREELALVDQQQQFADCWQARAALDDDDRVAAVCADLGISPSARTTCAASSPSPKRSANASPNAPPAPSCRRRWPTGWPTCTRSPRS
jgi:hypothetical protein